MRNIKLEKAALSNMLLGGIIGAPIGAIAGAGTAAVVDKDETAKERRKRILNQSLLGAVLAGTGGAALQGIALPAVAEQINQAPPIVPNKIKKELINLGGAGAGAIAGTTFPWRSESTLQNLVDMIKKHKPRESAAFLRELDKGFKGRLDKHVAKLRSQGKSSKEIANLAKAWATAHKPGRQSSALLEHLIQMQKGRIGKGQLAFHALRSLAAPVIGAGIGHVGTAKVQDMLGGLNKFLTGRGLVP